MDKVKVLLLQSLTDAGVRHEEGEVVELDKDTADWAKSEGIASPLSAPEKE